MSNEQKDSLDLNVVARAPFNVYFEGKALSVTATNSVGVFDVLPGHADFFSILTPGEINIETKNEQLTININNGIITVTNNNVSLFINM